MSLAFPNTVLNTIVAEAIDELADQLESELGSGGGDLAEAVNAVVKSAYTEAKRVIFGGDNYSDEWHAEAERRGLKNLRTTPTRFPRCCQTRRCTPSRSMRCSRTASWSRASRCGPSSTR